MQMKKIMSNAYKVKNTRRLVVKRENAIARKREQRAKEAVSCLQLTGHDLWSGPLLDLDVGRVFSPVTS